MVVHIDYPMLARFENYRVPPENSDDSYYQIINYDEPEDLRVYCDDVEWYHYNG